jgi:CheY-like chemotaxis protein
MSSAAKVMVARRILVVEDDDDARAALRELLEVLGATVFTAADVQEAMAQIDAKPDVVLSDLCLPGENGLELARRLQLHPRREAMRLVAVTGFGGHADIALALAAGFDEVLQKPLLPEMLDVFVAG